MNSHVYILDECTAYNITNYPLSEQEAYNLTSNYSTHEPKKPLAVLYSFMYSKPQGLKSLLHNGTDHPDSVDFLRLFTRLNGRIASLNSQFSRGDGARNTRPKGNNSARLCTSFEPLPTLQSKPVEVISKSSQKGNTQMNHYPLTESEAYNLTNYTLDQVRAYRYLHEAHKNIHSWSLKTRIYGEMKEITFCLDMLEPTAKAIIAHFQEHSENPSRWREKAERLSTVLTQYKDLPLPEPINPEDVISRAETALRNASIGLSERLAQLCDIAEDIPHLSPQIAQSKLFDLLDDLEELQADLMGALLVTEGKNDE